MRCVDRPRRQDGEKKRELPKQVVGCYPWVFLMKARRRRETKRLSLAKRREEKGNNQKDKTKQPEPRTWCTMETRSASSRVGRETLLSHRRSPCHLCLSLSPYAGGGGRDGWEGVRFGRKKPAVSPVLRVSYMYARSFLDIHIRSRSFYTHPTEAEHLENHRDTGTREGRERDPVLGIHRRFQKTNLQGLVGGV